MDEIALTICLPLFDTSEPATAALENANLRDIRAVVSTDGTSFWLHDMSDLAQALGTNRSPTATFQQFRQRTLPVLSTHSAMVVGLDFARPQAAKVQTLLDDANTDMLVASTGFGQISDRVVMAYADPKGIFNTVSTKWVCEKYGESYPQSHGGQCPRHQGARLHRRP